MARGRPAGQLRPMRTCVACRTRRDKALLLRVVRQPDGRIELDESGRLEGRGAYLCSNPDCWRTAGRRALLQRALRTRIPDDLNTRLAQGVVLPGRALRDVGSPTANQGGEHGA